MEETRLHSAMSRLGRLTLVLLLMTTFTMFFGMKLLRGDQDLPVATGEPAAPVLPVDVQASRLDFETATFGMG